MQVYELSVLTAHLNMPSNHFCKIQFSMKEVSPRRTLTSCWTPRSSDLTTIQNDLIVTSLTEGNFFLLSQIPMKLELHRRRRTVRKFFNLLILFNVRNIPSMTSISSWQSSILVRISWSGKHKSWSWKLEIADSRRPTLRRPLSNLYLPSPIFGESYL